MPGNCGNCEKLYEEGDEALYACTNRKMVHVLKARYKAMGGQGIYSECSRKHFPEKIILIPSVLHQCSETCRGFVYSRGGKRL